MSQGACTTPSRAAVLDLPGNGKKGDFYQREQTLLLSDGPRDEFVIKKFEKMPIHRHISQGLTRAESKDAHREGSPENILME